MGKYKISVSLDKDNYFWIVVDKEIFIREPTEYDLICARLITYNPTNICPICREEADRDGLELTDKSILYPKNAVRGYRTGEWVCAHHRRELIEGRSKCKILVSKDEGNFFWIVVDKGKLIKNPVDLKYVRIKSYNKTNICPRCREEWKKDGIELTDKSILYPGNALRETDKKGNKLDEWVCHRHGYNHYQKYNPDSSHAIIKSLANRRIGNLHDPANIFADNCQECTCLWLGVEDLNIVNDNYIYPYDHSPISEGILIKIGDKLVDLSGKILQTKGAKLTVNMYMSVYEIVEYEIWSANIKREWNKEFDFLILHCASKDGNIIERIYIIPRFEISNMSQLKITKNPSKGVQWYEKYRLDESILELVNKIYHEILKK